MYRSKKIALVIPAYKEEKLIKPTLESVPDLIDKIYVVDDKSPDNQNQVIEKCVKKDNRIILLKHEKNLGCGGAIITGYLQSSKDNCDISVVVGGDTRDHVFPALVETVNRIKTEAAKKKELF